MTASNAAALQQLSDERRAVLARPDLPPEADPIVVPDADPISAPTQQEELSKPQAKTTPTPKVAAKVAPKSGEAEKVLHLTQQ